MRETDVGGLIKAWRNYREMTQRHLGDTAGLTWTLIGDYERGEVSPSMHQILKIAAGLRVSVFDFWKGPPGWKAPESWGVRGAQRAEQSMVKYFVGVPHDWTDDPAGLLAVPPAQARIGLVAMKVDNDECWPRIYAGDVVLVDTLRTKPGTGKYVVARGRNWVGIRRIEIRDRQRWLVAPNPIYPPLNADDYEVLGIVEKIINSDL